MTDQQLPRRRKAKRKKASPEPEQTAPQFTTRDFLIGGAVIFFGFFAIRGIIETLKPSDAPEQTASTEAEVSDESAAPTPNVEETSQADKTSEPEPVILSSNDLPRQPDVEDVPKEKMEPATQPEVTTSQALASVKPVEPEPVLEPVPEAVEEELEVIEGPTTKVEEVAAVVPPPIPPEILPIPEHEFDATRRSIRQSRTAENAHILYQRFAESYEFDRKQQDKVDEELKEWKERSDKGLVRLGYEWTTPENVAKASVEADEYIAQAQKLLDAGDTDEAIKLLEFASRVYPNGIRADYELGLMYAQTSFGAEGPPKSEKHFRRILVRDPTHAGAMNSLGIALLKQREYGDAFDTFGEAAELLEKCPEIVHNLARLVAVSEGERLFLPFTHQSACEELVKKLVESGKGSGLINQTGWLHMLPVFRQESIAESEAESEPEPEPTSESVDLVNVGSGSGFVVAPRYVLTNRHVVEILDFGIADRVSIGETKAGQSPMYGDVVAVSEKTDLALTFVPDLKLPPINLRSDLVTLASDVLILGYPQSQFLGTQLKVTQGIVSALPDPNRTVWSDYYYFDAIADHGNSGGPILGRDGRVLAVLTCGLAKTQFKAEFTAGIPSTDAIEFLQKHIPSYRAAMDQTPVEANWSAVTQAAQNSIVPVSVFYQAHKPAMAKKTAGPEMASRNVMEDITCVTCNGRSWSDCTNKDCRKGEISERRFRTDVVGVGAGRRTVRVPFTVKVDCLECENGTNDCPNCTDGFDYELISTSTFAPSR